MTSQKVQIQDEEGNIYYPNSPTEVKVKRNITIPTTGWTSSSYYSGGFQKQISDTDIKDDSVVDINIRIQDIDKASMLKEATYSFNGYVYIFADEVPTQSLICDMTITRQVI